MIYVIILIGKNKNVKIKIAKKKLKKKYSKKKKIIYSKKKKILLHCYVFVFMKRFIKVNITSNLCFRWPALKRSRSSILKWLSSKSVKKESCTQQTGVSSTAHTNDSITWMMIWRRIMGMCLQYKESDKGLWGLKPKDMVSKHLHQVDTTKSVDKK